MAAQALATASVDLRANTFSFAKDMKTALGIWDKSARDIASIRDKVAKTFYFRIAAGLTQGVNELGKALGQLAEKGEQAGSVRDAFRGLGGSTAAIEDARKRVVGLVDSFDLMQIANKGLLAGVPNFNRHFADLADVAARVADTLNKDTKVAMNELTDAIVKGQAKGLKPLGFSFSDVSDKAKVTQEALAQLPAVMQRLAPITDSAANANTALKNSWNELNKNIGITVNENPALISALRQLDEVVRKIDFIKVANELANFHAAVVRFVTAAIPPLVSALDAWQAAVDRISVAMQAGPFSSVAERERQLQILQEARAIDQAWTATNKWAASVKLLHTEMQAGAKPTAAAIEKLRDEAERMLDLIKKSPGGWDAFGLKGEVRHATELFKVLEQNKKKLIETSSNYEVKVDTKAADKLAKEQLERDKNLYEESIAFWESTFENAITGVTFDLQDSLKQVAVGFAAQMMASLTGISFSGGIKGLGGSIAQMILGGGVGGSSMMGGVGSMAGMLGATGALEGTYVGGMMAGLSGTSMAGSTAAMSSGMGMGGSIAAAGPYVAAAVAAYAIADKLGVFSGGTKNPDTAARRKVGGWFEEQLPQNGNFVVGANNRFNTEAGFAALHKLDKETQSVFTGFGAAIKETLGITEDVAEQVGTLIVENYGGSVDKAKQLWVQLGLSVEDTQQKIMQAAMKNNGLWLEVEGQLAAIDRLSQAGMDGVGDVAGAVGEIEESGGRGVLALKGIKDTAIEALEASGKSLEEIAALQDKVASGNASKAEQDMLKAINSLDALRKKMEEAGVAPDQIEKIITAAAQRGISELTQMATMSDRTAGAIIADITAMGFAFKEVAENIKEATSAMQDLSAAAGGTGLSVGADVPKFANGGMVSSPTLGIIGEAGPEAVMPLRRINGKLGVMSAGGAGGGGSPTIIVNAQNAAAGSETMIRRVMREYEDRIVKRAVSVVHQQSMRMS